MISHLYLILPLVIWGFFRLTLPNVEFDYDWDVAHATFSLLLDRYMTLARGMVAVDLLAAVYARHVEVNVEVIEVCVFAAVLAFAFSVWTLTSYEKYLHSRYPKSGHQGPSTYTANGYATTKALGYSSVIFTVAGVAMAVIYG